MTSAAMTARGESARTEVDIHPYVKDTNMETRHRWLRFEALHTLKLPTALCSACFLVAPAVRNVPFTHSSAVENGIR